MAFPWPARERVGLCPARLVLADSVVEVDGDPVEELERRAGKAFLTVVVSNHFSRYALLPWSENLGSESEWLAFAHHTFESVYGAAVAGWEVKVSPARRREARVASAVDGLLLSRLKSIPRISSIQPYAMAAFNADRKRIGEGGWLALQEKGRLTYGLLEAGSWKLLRSRKVAAEWPETLEALLERETAILDAQATDRVFLRSEEQPPPRLGRFQVTDLVSMPGGSLRACAMVLH